MDFRKLAPAAAKRRLHSGEEIAFLDVREAAPFGEGHPLFAVPCPYSRIEVSTLALVPRLDAAIILIDDGDGIAERSAHRLASCGYSDVSIVEGGMPAWADAGFGVFSGVYVPSKTLGELLEHSHHPKVIDAATLDEWQKTDQPHLFFDARPPEEFAKMAIKGARCLPNGELGHRFASVVHDDDIPIVITCAGRTRGIVGALGLLASGVSNPVFALENGTQGWALAGLPLARGTTPDPLPELDIADRKASRQRAQQLIERSGLPLITPLQVDALLKDEQRTTYLLDLRSARERADRPCPEAVPVLAGQLVQSTDQYVGVRHARLVLVDDTGLRAAFAAVFLRALGFEPYVLALDDEPAAPLAFARKAQLQPPAEPTLLTPTEAAQRVTHPGVVILDVRPSQDRERGRLTDSIWAVRSQLPALLPPGISEVILYTADAAGAAACSLDLVESGITTFWLNADLATCAAASLSVDNQKQAMAREQAVDRVWFVHDRHDGNREASLQYLAWEMGLLAQLDAEERAEFADMGLAPVA